jgi:hypothetical protein
MSFKIKLTGKGILGAISQEVIQNPNGVSLRDLTGTSLKNTLPSSDGADFELPIAWVDEDGNLCFQWHLYEGEYEVIQ